MRKARQVYCLGQGGSMYIANDICARFACISTKFRTAGDSHLQLITASLMTPEDVVLFVSYSGATRDMLETLRAAKAAGAKIILLTHYEDSPGAKLADIVLLCGAQESPLDSGNIPVKVALLYVAEVLVLRYTMDTPSKAPPKGGGEKIVRKGAPHPPPPKKKKPLKKESCVWGGGAPPIPSFLQLQKSNVCRERRHPAPSAGNTAGEPPCTGSSPPVSFCPEAKNESPVLAHGRRLCYTVKKHGILGGDHF